MKYFAKSSRTFVVHGWEAKKSFFTTKPYVDRKCAEHNCWPDELLKCDIRVFCMFAFVASDKATLSQWHCPFFRYFWYNISLIEGEKDDFWSAFMTVLQWSKKRTKEKRFTDSFTQPDCLHWLYYTGSSLYKRGYHLSSICLATVNPGVLTGVKICSGFR